jgi:transposase
MIAVVRLRHCERTQAYARKRAADGLSKRNVLRCLKRYIARQTYVTLRDDLQALDRA